MMRRSIPVVLCCLMLFICCSHDEYEDVLVRFSGSIPEGECWWSTFAASPSSQIIVEFDLHSGGPVDIITLDQDGFSEFEDRVDLDSLMAAIWGLQLEEYNMFSFYADSGKYLHFDIMWAIDSSINPVDIFLLDSLNYALYVQGSYQMDFLYRCFWCLGAVFDYDVVRSESLYLVMDNTSYGYPPLGMVCYRFKLCEYIARAFSYCEEGSSFNTGTTSYTFAAPEYDTLYVVVNNAGFVEGGSHPVGPVKFSISVTED